MSLRYGVMDCSALMECCEDVADGIDESDDLVGCEDELDESEAVADCTC
jgi:hypothetical protein